MTEKLLLDNVNKIEEISYNLIKHTEYKINLEWEHNIDNSKFEINMDDPTPSDPNINYNYDIY